MGLLPGGWATQIKFNSDLVLCTSFDFPENPVLIESSGAYGGSMNGPTEQAMGSPYLLDYGGVNGSFAYEPSQTQAINLIRWLGSRNTSYAITADTPGGVATYNPCFFTNIGFQVAEDTVVTANADVWAMRRPLSTDIIGSGSSIRQVALEVPTVTLIPYWTTSITPLTNALVSWNLTASQDLVKKFFCDASAATDAPEPDYVLVGMLNIELGLQMLALSSVTLSALMLDFTTATHIIKFGTTTFLTMDNMTTTGAQPNIADMGGFYTLDTTYTVHKITLPAAPTP